MKFTNVKKWLSMLLVVCSLLPQPANKEETIHILIHAAANFLFIFQPPIFFIFLRNFS